MAKAEQKLSEAEDLTSAIKRAITDSQMTHYAIGKASGVAPDLIGRFMSGERGINLGTASKLATALGYKLVKCDDATVLEKQATTKKK